MVNCAMPSTVFNGCPFLEDFIEILISNGPYMIIKIHFFQILLKRKRLFKIIQNKCEFENGIKIRIGELRICKDIIEEKEAFNLCPS